jgi:hypothetical protein
MANVYAVKSGNWSDVTLWNTGNLPATIDDVYANNFTVYVDNSYQVSLVTNLSSVGITAGGRFILNNAVALSANVIGGGANAVAAVQFLSASPNFCTLVGNLCAVNTTIQGPRALLNNSSGTFTVYGNGLGRIKSAVGNPADGYIQNQSTGTLNLFGNYIAGVNAPVDNRGIWNQSTGTINLVGELSGGIPASSEGMYNSSTGTTNITGTVFGGVGSTGVTSPGGGLVNIVGDVIGGIATAVTLGSTTTGSIIGNVRAGNAGDGVIISSSSSLTVYGNVSAWGPATNSFGIIHSSTGTLIIVGNVYGGFGISSYGFRNTSTGTTIISGNVIGGQASSWGGDNNGSGVVYIYGNIYGSNIAANSEGYQNSSAGTTFVYGNVYGDLAVGLSNTSTGSAVVFGDVYGGTTATAYGTRNVSTGLLILSGSAVGGIGSTAYGAFNNSTGVLRVKRAVGNNWGLGYTTALAGTPGVFSNAQGSQTFVEELECGPRGQWPTGGVIFFTPNPKATALFKTDTFQNYTLIQSNSADNLLPPVSSVRQNEIYNLGMDTGTCVIPPASSVSFGASVDNTTGTATLISTNVWNISSQEITDSQSLGGRLKNTLTANAAEKLVNSFNLN